MTFIFVEFGKLIFLSNSKIVLKQHKDLTMFQIAFFLLYLFDVKEGGETVFPFENGMNMDGTNVYTESIGLKVKPRRGDGLLFYSLSPNGTIDALKDFEFAKAVHLDPVPFDMDRDLLTRTFKKKRPQLLIKYYQVSPLFLYMEIFKL
ncbi:hypothetical protein LguiB_025345 [Lonicera macranthoides]